MNMEPTPIKPIRKPKPVKLKAASEKNEQLALIEWARYRDIRLVHHVNEGRRSRRQGAELKDLGLSPGYPDLSLADARGGYFGLFIEMKQKRKYTDSEMNTECWKNQSDWLTHLANKHYYALRCFGWDHAREIVEMYINWPETIFTPNQRFAIKTD